MDNLLFCVFMTSAGVNLGNAIFRKDLPEWIKVLVFSMGIFCLGMAILNLLYLRHV
jgi:hypothetical protein